MVIHDFNIVSATFAPAETNPPLVIDTDAVLARTVSLQTLQAIAWRTAQVIQAGGAIQVTQFAQGHGLYVMRESPRELAAPDAFGFAALEAADHEEEDGPSGGL